MTDPASLVAAFIGGVLSFLLPCTLVLVPVFLAHLTGVAFSSAGGSDASARRLPLVLHTLGFIAGFTAVFVLLGASLGFLSETLSTSQVWVARIGGVVIIYFGLIALGLLHNPFIMIQRLSFNPRSEHLGYLGSVLVGAGIGVGWAPCVGPILGSILVLAGASGSALQGSILLLFYSLGMMLPFLGFGLFSATVHKFIRGHMAWIHYSSYASGAFLIVLGVLVFTENLRELLGFFVLRPCLASRKAWTVSVHLDGLPYPSLYCTLLRRPASPRHEVGECPRGSATT